MPAINSIVTELVPPAGLSQALGPAADRAGQRPPDRPGASPARCWPPSAPRPRCGWARCCCSPPRCSPRACRARDRAGAEAKPRGTLVDRIPRRPARQLGHPDRARLGALQLRRRACSWCRAVAMLVPLKVQSLGLSAAWLGWCEAGAVAGPAGRLAGPGGLVGARPRPLRRARERRGADRPGAGAGRLDQRPPRAGGLFAVVGCAAPRPRLVGKTHRMLARPLAYRARMSAAAIMTVQLSQTLGPAIAGLALAHWSVRTRLRGVRAAERRVGARLLPGAGLPRVHGAGARRGRRLVRQDVSAGLRGRLARSQLSRWCRLCQSASDSFG